MLRKESDDGLEFCHCDRKCDFTYFVLAQAECILDREPELYEHDIVKCARILDSYISRIENCNGRCYVFDNTYVINEKEQIIVNQILEHISLWR